MTQLNPEAATESAHCEIHGEYEAKIIQLFERRIVGRCPYCEQAQLEREAQREREQEQRVRERRIKTLHQSSGIPQRFSQASFDAYRPPTKQAQANHAMCRAYADQFVERADSGASLVLCGKPGTGKTHLACAIGNHVIDALAQPVIYTSVTKLARSIKATYSRDAEQTEEQAIQQYVEPALLIVDEVGAQRGSETELLLAQEIIDERYQQMRPTIVISNLPERELAGFIGERALDRMYEGGGAVMAFDWSSYRRGGSEA